MKKNLFPCVHFLLSICAAPPPHTPPPADRPRMLQRPSSVGLRQSRSSGSPPRSARPGAALLRPSLSPLRAAAPDGSAPQQPPPPVRWLPTLLTFAPAALGGALFGYDIGATSGALSSLNSAAAGVDWAGPGGLSSLAAGAVVSSSLLGALLGSGAAFAGGEALGRRGELITAGVLYTAASLGEATAGSLPALLAARALYGLAIGAAMHAAPAYIAETAPPSVRGLLISAKEFCIVGGILAGFSLAFALAASGGGGGGEGAVAAGGFAGFVGGLPAWRVLYGSAAPFAGALTLSALASPESPRWLALAGKGEGAVAASLRRCRGVRQGEDENVEAEAACISRAAAEAAPTAAADASIPALALLSHPRYARPVRLCLGLMLAQQVTGQPSVLYFAASIFEGVGFAPGAGAAGVAAGLGAFKLLATGVAVLAVDRAGRRPLLIGGVGGMTVALVALAAAQAAAGAGPPPLPGAPPTPAAWGAVAALLAYVAAYQVSFGPISWLIVGEALPLAVRGRAAALATLVNFGANFGVSLALPSVQAALGPAGTYAVFAVIAALSTAAIAAGVPETKGKSLEEIEAMMMGGERSGGGVD